RDRRRVARLAAESVMDPREILSPPLPYVMGPRVAKALADEKLMRSVENGTETRLHRREDACRAAFGDRYDALRVHAGAIKQQTLDRLDHWLGLFVDRAQANGTRVHFARDSDAANAIVLEIARRAGASLCVKSKSMVTEETGLLHELEKSGVETL